MKLLFADDEYTIRKPMGDALKKGGHSITLCADGLEAKEAIRKESFDVIIVDLDMPGADGLSVLEYARELNSEADAIIQTGKGDYQKAITAIHHGVTELLTKPYKINELELVLKRIEEKRNLMRECYLMKKQIQHFEGERKLIGDSVAMQQVQHLIAKVAATDSTVVILGETGTGKELVARAIHEQSSRQGKPFVAVNCGALPETLIESELFGHRKGSFTGADANRMGLLEVANGGTLFLDEIGELPKGVQAKLLRFLESGEVRKIGENSSTTCNVRVVCATLRDLELMVREGDFREDLWFRINTFEIHLPALRQRRGDIQQLILYLARRFRPSAEFTDVAKLFTAKALQKLEHYDWPGNVRQLANTIEHALILSEKDSLMDVDCLPHHLQDVADVLDLPQNASEENQTQGRKLKSESRPEVNKNPTTLSAVFPALQTLQTPQPVQLSEPITAPQQRTSTTMEHSLDQSAPLTLRDLEMQAIEAALHRHGGNKSKAAEELGISLKTLYNKLNQTEGKRTA